MTAQPVPVHLLEFPTDVWQRALEHHTELLREFSLISIGQQFEDGPTVPTRLLHLIEALNQEYAGVTEEPDTRRDKAVADGLTSIDLTYHVAPAAAEASLALGALLDEADEFCRSGGALLTLATPPDARQFREWYLGEFIGQVAGRAPISWPAYCASLAADA